MDKAKGVISPEQGPEDIDQGLSDRKKKEWEERQHPSANIKKTNVRLQRILKERQRNVELYSNNELQYTSVLFQDRVSRVCYLSGRCLYPHALRQI